MGHFPFGVLLVARDNSLIYDSNYNFAMITYMKYTRMLQEYIIDFFLDKI